MSEEIRTRPKNRRESILATASVRFHQRGYAGTSLDDIARDLGVTAPALYRHFRNKDDLYTAALETNLRHLESALAEAATARDAVSALAHVAVSHPTLGLLWNTDRRRRLVDPDGSIEQRLVAVADDLGALFEADATTELSRLLARGALAAASSTGFYQTDLEASEHVAHLESAIAAVVAFRPAQPLLALEVVAEAVVSRPWTTRRSALLDAGALLVVQRGSYQAVSVEEIAAAAGVSPNTVYSHFTGKADLFAAVLLRVASWLTASLQQASAQATTAAEALRLAVVSSLDLSTQHPSWTSTLADEMSNLPAEQIAELAPVVDEYLADWLAVCAANAPDLPVEAVRVRMRAALAVIDDRALEAADRRVLSNDDSAALMRAMLIS